MLERTHLFVPDERPFDFDTPGRSWPWSKPGAACHGLLAMALRRHRWQQHRRHPWTSTATASAGDQRLKRVIKNARLPACRPRGGCPRRRCRWINYLGPICSRSHQNEAPRSFASICEKWWVKPNLRLYVGRVLTRRTVGFFGSR
jgi:hypothetical protein